MILGSSNQEENHDHIIIESEQWNSLVGLLARVHQKESKVAKLVNQLETAVEDVKKINRDVRKYMKEIHPEFYERIIAPPVKLKKMDLRKKLSVHMKEIHLSKYTEIAKKMPKFLDETSNFALDSTEYKTTLSKTIDFLIKNRVSISVVISNS